MDIDKLSNLLSRAASEANIAEPPKDVWCKETHIVNNIQIKEQTTNELMETLKAIPGTSTFDDKMFNYGCGYSIRVSLELLIRSLIYSTWKYGIEETLNNFTKYMELDGNPIYEVQLVSGIEIEQEIELSHNTRLIPYDNIPECWQKTYFHPDRCQPFYKNYCSRAAIIRDVQVSPKSHHQDAPPKRISRPDIQLSNICDLLTIVGPSAPRSNYGWPILKEEIPVKFDTGYFGGIDCSSCSTYKYNLVDSGLAQTIVKDFQLMSDKLKDTILLATKRLNMAQRRNSMENKAIDLGIALEILLLGDRNKFDMISFPFRLRGAWFLGEGEKRQYVYEILREIYDCRCSAVHSGKIKKHRYKINDQEMQLPKLLEEGCKLCADLINRVIEEKKFPDWDKLTLGL